MPKKYPKVYAFIDSNNLYRGVSGNIPKKKYKGWKLDYQRFRVYLRQKYGVVKAFLFIGYIKENSLLYSRLRRYGYTLKFKETVQIKDRKGKTVVKGNVDAELVMEVMIEINNFDKALIVSGDGDYSCIIRYLSKKGKLGKILVPNYYSYSSLLTPYRKYTVYMNHLRDKLGKKKSGSVACST